VIQGRGTLSGGPTGCLSMWVRYVVSTLDPLCSTDAVPGTHEGHKAQITDPGSRITDHRSRLRTATLG